MDRKTPDEVMSLDAAKERVRVAAAEHPLFGWVRRHPREGAVGAFLLGFVLSRYPRLGGALGKGTLFALRRL
ncbi:MAG: hypothetical protein HY900_22230 [Deltaproteobacteria bacterium]|nr:hypothetical protein [Deltaproteobacteria bacterium]